MSNTSFDSNIDTIGGVIKAFYSYERTDNEHYPQINDIFKYCGLECEEEKTSIDFDLSEEQANYLGDYVLLHFYLKKYQSCLFKILNKYKLPKPSFISNHILFCDITLSEYFDWFYDTNKHDWMKIVEFFEPIQNSKNCVKLGKHIYINDDNDSELKFDSSKILKLTTNKNDLSEYTSLKCLIFSGSKFIGLTTTIEHIYCRKTKITEIPSNLINLISINCSRTQITEIPSSLTKFVNLDCYRTNIKEIPSTFTNLTYLQCSRTQITEIPKTLVNLQHLICRNTQIKEIPKELVNLEILNCSNTQIKEIPKELVNLQELECSGFLNLYNIRLGIKNPYNIFMFIMLIVVLVFKTFSD